MAKGYARKAPIAISVFVAKVGEQNVRRIRPCFQAQLEGKPLIEPSVPRPPLPRSTAAGDDTLRNWIEPMEGEGAVGESEEEEEGAVVDVGVSDSEEELEVLTWPD